MRREAGQVSCHVKLTGYQVPAVSCAISKYARRQLEFQLNQTSSVTDAGSCRSIDSHTQFKSESNLRLLIEDAGQICSQRAPCDQQTAMWFTRALLLSFLALSVNTCRAQSGDSARTTNSTQNLSPVANVACEWSWCSASGSWCKSAELLCLLQPGMRTQVSCFSKAPCKTSAPMFSVKKLLAQPAKFCITSV